MPKMSEVRAVEWGRSYLWNVKFHNRGIATLKEPFDTFIPAEDVEENIATLESYMFTQALTTFKVPQSTTLFDIKLTLGDDVKLTIEHWIDEWVNKEILNNGNGLGYLEDIVKLLEIEKLDLQHNVISSKSYWVYPEVALYYHGNSQSETPKHNLTFIVCGMV